MFKRFPLSLSLSLYIYIYIYQSRYNRIRGTFEMTRKVARFLDLRKCDTSRSWRPRACEWPIRLIEFIRNDEGEELVAIAVHGREARRESQSQTRNEMKEWTNVSGKRRGKLRIVAIVRRTVDARIDFSQAGSIGRSRARLWSVALVSVGYVRHAALSLLLTGSARRERQARPRKTEHHGRHMRSCCRGGCQRRRRLRGDTLGVPSCTSASGCPWYQASMTSQVGRGDRPAVPRRETRAITSSGTLRARRASARFASRDSDRCRVHE
jgi:hypothetical protein